MKAPMFQTHTYVYLYVTMRFQNVQSRSIQQAIQQELLVMAIFLTRCPPRPREEMRRVDQRNYRWCNCILLPFVLIERLWFILFQRGPGVSQQVGLPWFHSKRIKQVKSLAWCPPVWGAYPSDGFFNNWWRKKLCESWNAFFRVKRRKGESLEKSSHTFEDVHHLGSKVS